MSNSTELLAEIQNLIIKSKTSSMTSSSNACDLFEVYILGLILKAATNEGAKIDYENVNGKTPTDLIFRTSPGQIFWKNKDYCHAIINFPDKPVLEAHVGIYVSGKSKVMHECDVAVIYRDEGLTCRRREVTPRQSKLFMAVECKFYSRSLPLAEARGFIGLSTDIGARISFLAVNTDSPSAAALISNRDGLGTSWEDNVVPSSTLEVNRLTSLFEKRFNNFKAAK